MPSPEYEAYVGHPDPNIRDLVEQMTAYGLRYSGFRLSHLALMQAVGVNPEIIGIEIERQLSQMPSKEFH